MTRWIKILLIVSLSGAISCQSYRDKKKLQQDLTSFLNSEIVFPPGLIPFQLPDSTQSSDLLNRPYKIVIFIDSAECNDCRIRMLKQGWEPFLKEIQDNDLSCIIIFNTSQPHPIQNAMENMYLSLPYFLDTESRFPKLNEKVRLNSSFKTFLTRENKVILAGDPTANPNLKKLYLDQLRK